ncbi:choice-of-anchor K domain-containing protein [Microbacterium sp. NPDC058389]|uniref:choice-of-anchor K domain-containing protein n=1 Tax=Microbacterium sp. NPDC058389 TaxID=3346475 RepID=UPI00365FC288
MHVAFARPRAFTPTERAGAGRGRRLLTAALATVLLVAPASIVAGVAMDAAPAAAAEVTIPLEEDVQTRMTSHTGWDGSTAANPSTGDCVRYGSAADGVTTGPIANPGGSAGTDAAAWSDGATGWVSYDDTAYSAHGRGGSDCSTQLDLSSQSAVGFSPASIASVQTGIAFNLGRMVHRNNPVYTTNQWFRGDMDVRLLGLDLSYAWQLHETPNQANPPENPANNDVLEFVSTVSEHSFEGPDGNRYTLVVSGFASPRGDGTCAATLADPGEAINRFETVERTSTYGCLYGEIQQVRSLTVVKAAAAAHSAPDAIPSFGFTTDTATPGSAWTDDFALAPTGVGAEGAASVTRDVVVGETLTIAEDPTAGPWSFTSLVCVDGTGAVLPLTSGGQIRIAGDLAASDAAAAPITCTYTNTYDPRGDLVIAKTVTPRDGTPAAGFTGGDTRSFDIAYACTLDGTTVAHGTAPVTTSTPATVTGLPAGAECAVTGEDVSAATGDFADDTFAWDGYTVSAAAVVVTTDAAATLTVDNRFVRDEPAPTPTPTPTPPTETTPPVTPPVTPPGDSTPPAPPTADGPTGGLALTGAGPVLPFALTGAGLMAAGALVALLLRRRKAQD